MNNGDPIRDFYKGYIYDKGLFSNEKSFRDFISNPKNASDFFSNNEEVSSMFRNEDEFINFLGIKKKVPSQAQVTYQQGKEESVSVQEETPFLKLSEAPQKFGYKPQPKKEVTEDWTAYENVLSELNSASKRKTSAEGAIKTGVESGMGVFPEAEKELKDSEKYYSTVLDAAKAVSKAKAEQIKSTVSRVLESDPSGFMKDDVFDEAKAIAAIDKETDGTGAGSLTRYDLVNTLRVAAEQKRDLPKIQQYAAEEIKKSGVDVEKYSQYAFNKAAAPVRSILDGINNEAKLTGASLKEKYQKVADEEKTEYENSIKELQDHVNMGHISAEDARAAAKELTDKYIHASKEIDKMYQSEYNTAKYDIEKKWNENFEKLKSISISESDVEAEIPKDVKEKIDLAYESAAKRLERERNEAKKAGAAASDWVDYISRTAKSAWNSTIADIGNWMVYKGWDGDVSKWMRGKRTAAESLAPPEFDPKKEPFLYYATSAIRNIGGAAPIMIPAIAGTLATRNLGTAGAVMSSIGSGVVENVQVAGEVFGDVAKQKGITEAILPTTEAESKLGETLLAYGIQGIAIDRLLTRGLAKKIAGTGYEIAGEYATEYPQSFIQYRAEGGTDDFQKWAKDNPTLAVEVPLGAVAQSATIASAAKIYSNIMTSVPNARAQYYSDIIQKHGVRAAIDNLNMRYQAGSISKDGYAIDKEAISKAATQINKFSELGIKGDDAKALMAASNKLNSLKKKSKSEKDSAVKTAIDSQIKDQQQLIDDIMAGTARYAIVEVPGGSGLTFVMPTDKLSDDIIKSSESIKVVNDPLLNGDIQNRKRELGNATAPDGFYKNETYATGGIVQSQYPGAVPGQQQEGQREGEQRQETQPQTNVGDSIRSSEEGQRLIDRAKIVVNSLSDENFTAAALKKAASEGGNEFVQMMLEINQQAIDPDSAESTDATYGKDIINMAGEFADMANVANIRSEIMRRFPEEVTAEDFRSEPIPLADVESKMTSEFKTPEELSDFIKNGTYAFAEAGNPRSQQLSQAANEKLQKRADRWLAERGLQPVYVAGVWGGNAAPSMLIPNMTQQQALGFAREFGQDAVAHSSGLIFKEGTISPIKKENTSIGVNEGDRTIIKVGDQNVGVSLDYSTEPQAMTTVADELNEEFFAETKALIENIRKSLASAGISVETVPDEKWEELAGRVGVSKNTGGVFVDEEGKIYLNERVLQDSASSGLFVWHEAIHPVINIIRNTNPELLNGLVSDIKELAKTNADIAEVVSWAESNYAEEDVEDEMVVETIARIGDGRISLDNKPTSFIDKIKELLNKIAKIFGFGKAETNSDIITLANKITQAFESGAGIETIVGEENVGKYKREFGESPSVQARVEDFVSDDNPLFVGNLRKAAASESINTVNELKNYFQDKFNKYSGEIKKRFGNDEEKYMSDILTKESLLAVADHPEAIGWYNDKVTKAVDVLALSHPEIKTDPNAKAAFMLALAITSNGNEVFKNFELADELYRRFSIIERFDIDIDFGARNKPIKKSLTFINNILDSGVTPEELVEFFKSEVKVGDLKYRDKNTGKLSNLMAGELADEDVKAAGIIGSKIGNGFLMNLYGDYSTPTVDLWFMRMWKRLNGTIIEKNKELIYKNKSRVSSAVSSLTDSEKERLADIIGNIPKSVDVISEKVSDATIDPSIRKQFNTENLDELRRASIRYEVLKSGEFESPKNGSEKSKIRKVFNTVVGKLRTEHGIEITPADLQAALWYSEKSLYDAFGTGKTFDSVVGKYSSDEAPDYYNAAVELAKEKGFTNEQIRNATTGGAGVTSGELVGSGAEISGGERRLTNREILERIRESRGGERELIKKNKAKAQARVDDEIGRLEKYLTDDGNGNYNFYHYSDKKFDNVNPNRSGANLVTGKDERPGVGIVAFYTKPDVREPGVPDEYGYVVKVPKEKVYPFNSDPLGFYNEAEERFKKKFGEDAAFDSNKQLGFITQVAAENGYPVTVAEWRMGGRKALRAQTTESLPVKIYRTKTGQNTYEYSGDWKPAKKKAQARRYGVEDTKEFKLAAFVMRKKEEGSPDIEIAQGVKSVFPQMTNQEITSLVNDPGQYIKDKFSYLSEALRENLVQRAKTAKIYRPYKKRDIDASRTIGEIRKFKPEEMTGAVGTTANKLIDWLTKKKNRFFDSARGLPDYVMAEGDFAKGEKNVDIATAERIVSRLKTTANKIGFEDWDAFIKALKSVDFVKRNLSDRRDITKFDAGVAAAGKPFTTPDDQLPSVIPDEIKELPEEIRPFVYEMRGMIDRLSTELIERGYVTPEQAKNIEDNIGQYTNRAYKLYNEKMYRPTKESIRAAQAFLANIEKDKGRSDEDAINEANKQIKSILDGKKNPYFGSVDLKRDTGILKERKDIPEPIRKLMGEYTDPGVVFVMTVAKQASLKAASQYMTKLREFGMGTLFYEENDPNRPVNYSVPMSTAGSESMTPLDGLFTTPEIKDALSVIDPTYNDLTHTWMQIVGAVRWTKTVGSVATQFKNFESNIGFAVMNGLFLTGENMDALKAAGSYVKSQFSQTELDELTKKSIKLGLVGQAVGYRELRDMFGSGDLNRIAADLAVTGKRNPLSKAGTAVVGTLNKFYRLGDEFWKVYAYINERGQLANAIYKKDYDSLTEQEKEVVDIEASERVKNTWPTYDRVWEGAKYISKRAPVFGNFISFQAESVRVLANSISLAAKDIKSGNPEFVAMGAKRMAGIIAYLSIRAGMVAATAMMARISGSGFMGWLGDDEDKARKEALRDALPQFMRTGDLFVMKGKNPWEYTVINMSSLDPYGIFFNTLNAVTEGRESLVGGKMEPGAAAALVEFFNPFTELEMTFGTLQNIMSNKDDRGNSIVLQSDSRLDAIKNIMKYAYDKLEPSTAAMIERFIDRDNKGAEAWAALGARPYDVDLHKSFDFVLANAGKQFEEVQKRYGFGKDDTPEKISEAEKNIESAKKKIVDQVARIKRNFVLMGADDKVLEDKIYNKSAVKMSGFNNEVKAGMSGKDYNESKLYK